MEEAIFWHMYIQTESKAQTLKCDLQGLNPHLSSYAQKIQQIREMLEITQRKLASKPVNHEWIQEEKKLLQNFYHWNLMEEKVLMQKFWAVWIKYGDANSKYFHVQSRIKASRSNIYSIDDTKSNKIIDPTLVDNEFIGFISGLMGTTVTKIPCQNYELFKRDPCLTHPQKMELIKEVIDQEILCAFKSMPVGKAPGVDGFLVQFFTGQ